ncbi:hypothetical protein PR001_g29683, partial [Phytophthora rubi]
DYATIVEDSEAERVGVRVLPPVTNDDEATAQGEPEDSLVWVLRPRANICRVWAGELTAGAPGRLLRRPVFALTENRPYYGQVTAYEGSLVTIRHGDQMTQVPVSDVEEVAPVIVFLLHKAQLMRRLESRSAIGQAHTRLLDRLMGTEEAPGTRDVRRLLTGIAPVAAHPRPTATLTWMDPRTGRDSSCSVRHVIDFGFYVDGNHDVPADTALGAHFWEDPNFPGPPSGPQPTPVSTRLLGPRPRRTPARRAARTSPAGLEEVPPTPDQSRDHLVPPGAADQSRFVEFMDALDTSPFDTAHSDQGSLATAPPAQTTTPSAGPGRRTRSDENPFSTVDASMRILAALAEQPDLLQHYARQLGDQERDPKRPRYSSISDLQPTDDSTGRLDRQHSFRPSARQQDVHALTCADDHRDLPPLPREPSHGDLKAALGVLGTYSEEFFDPNTRSLVSAAKDFAEELSDYEPWSSNEVKTLAFWFSNIFAAYRRSCEHDLDHGSATRLDVRSRFSMQDPELSGMLLKMSRQRMRMQLPSSASVDAGRSNVQATGLPTRSVRGNPKEAPKRQVPTEVGLATPRQGGKQLCLRFISARGCPSASADRCTHSFLGHFVPTTKLDPVVKAHVQDKLGGLRPDLQHL